MTLVDDDVAVWASDASPFRSEWRVYVLRRDVLGIGHYAGDPLAFPDRARIEAMIAAYNDAPVGYALDVGVLESGATDLVEVNDAYALGNYGLPSTLYAQMLEARWGEIVGGAPTAL